MTEGKIPGQQDEQDDNRRMLKMKTGAMTTNSRGSQDSRTSESRQEAMVCCMKRTIIHNRDKADETDAEKICTNPKANNACPRSRKDEGLVMRMSSPGRGRANGAHPGMMRTEEKTHNGRRWSHDNDVFMKRMASAHRGTGNRKHLEKTHASETQEINAKELMKWKNSLEQGRADGALLQNINIKAMRSSVRHHGQDDRRPAQTMSKLDQGKANGIR